VYGTSYPRQNATWQNVTTEFCAPPANVTKRVSTSHWHRYAHPNPDGRADGRLLNPNTGDCRTKQAVQENRARRCDYRMASASQVNELSMKSLVEILFGESEHPETAHAVLKLGPHTFVTTLAAPEMSDAVTHLVCSRARSGHATFAIPTDDVRQLIVYFFKWIYGATTVDRIGIDTSLAMQRMLHDCAVGVGRTFQSLHLAGTPSAAWQPDLTRALSMLLSFTQAVRSFLPSARASTTWTDAHVFANALKNTEGSILKGLSAACNNLPMLLLCDGVLGEIMKEDVVCQRTLDLGSGFGACACSPYWRRVAKFAGHARVGRLMSNSEAFNDAVRVAFATPLCLSPPNRSLPPSRPVSPLTETFATTNRVETPADEHKRRASFRGCHTPCKLGF
jgi:hypothetical protein